MYKKWTQHCLTVGLVILAIYSPQVFAKYKRNPNQNFPPTPTMPSPESAPKGDEAAIDAMEMMGDPMMGFRVRAKPKPTKPQIRVEGNDLVDRVMAAVKKQLVNIGLTEVHPPDVEFDENNCKVGLYEGKIVGITNFHRVGDVVTVAEPLSTKFRSAFGFTDLSYDTGVEVACANHAYDNGRMTMTCDNATVFQVYKLNHVSQMLTLDEFEASLGQCQNKVSGLGDNTEEASRISNVAVEKAKPPLLKIFNISFKIAVNIGIQAVRSSLMSG